jgi:hypothetical protein
MMFKTILESGEYSLGNYRVQYAHWINGKWSGSGHWLNVLVTNRRLLLLTEMNGQMERREKIDPAEIVGVWNLCLGRRDAILVALQDGRQLYMLVDWSQGYKLARDINDMLAVPLKPHIRPRQPLI